jgi:hypothetical protein
VLAARPVGPGDGAFTVRSRYRSSHSPKLKARVFAFARSARSASHQLSRTLLSPLEPPRLVARVGQRHAER